MDVRNSVVLMVQIDAEIAEGRDPWDAVVAATMHRFRPILLTASAAALGMVPIVTTVFWGPFAIAVIGGLAVATLMTLTFLPALYVLWFRVKEPSPRPESWRETVPLAVAPSAAWASTVVRGRPFLAQYFCVPSAIYPFPFVRSRPI